tara:strand:+ start:199 stop:831 length:633 start_codon:yes stop_codon:yes gene_type:complete
MLRLCAAANTIEPPSHVNHTKFTTIQSTIQKRQIQKRKSKSKNNQTDVTLYSETPFDTAQEALKYCWKNPPNPDGIDIKHIGIDSKGNVITTADMNKVPFVFENLPDTIEWMWLKAFDPTLLSSPSSKKSNNPYTMCNIAQKEVQMSIHKRGVVRRVYTMPDHRYLKLSHHSCEYLKATYPGRKMCKNCINKGWNAKCTGGEDFIFLQDR